MSKSSKASGASPSVEPGDAVAVARSRARRRLIGAVVLLGVGIIGFPLVFETQPRPIPVNIPIEIPGKEGLPPLAMPTARPAPPASVPVPREEVVTEAPPPASAPPAAPSPVAAAPAPAAKASAPATPASRPAEARPAADAQPREAARAQALLDGKEAARTEAARAEADKPDAAAGRFVLQVGAFTDQASVREVRAKVEKLGLKTYTQSVETASGSRTRVRVGPFASREEAARALARAKAAGVDGVVLAL